MTVRELREVFVDYYEITFVQEKVVFEDQTEITDDLLDKNVEACIFYTTGDEYLKYGLEIFTE